MTSRIILDFEASALENGYPISIGVAAGDGRLFYRIIKPDPTWSELAWVDEGEKIHGLSREYIAANGDTPKQVMAELNAFFRDEVLTSDNPPYEWRWLKTLEAAGGRAAFKLSSISAPSVLSEAATGLAIDAASLATINRLRKEHATHNALRDAVSWLAAAEAIAGWTPATTEVAIVAVFDEWRARADRYLDGFAATDELGRGEIAFEEAFARLGVKRLVTEPGRRGK